MQKSEWVLRGFDRNTEKLANELYLVGLDLLTAQSIFNEPPDNPMYDSYPVTLDMIDRLQIYADAEIDIEKYECFLECDAL